MSPLFQEATACNNTSERKHSCSMINHSIPDAILPIITIHTRSLVLLESIHTPDVNHIIRMWQLVFRPAPCLQLLLVLSVWHAQFQALLHYPSRLTTISDVMLFPQSPVTPLLNKASSESSSVRPASYRLQIPQLLQVFTAELIL
jgi:hypothetical protein